MTETYIPVRATSGREYVPGIDGLRAMAVLAVMIFHLIPGVLPGGFTGVDVFFVISGYVVTGSLFRDANLSFHKFLASFYARRFRRIVPALVVCLIVTIAFSVAFIPDAWLSDAIRTTALEAFFGLSNFALVAMNDGYFAVRSEFNPFTHTWSLAVEEQFYLLFPLLLYLWIRRPSSLAAGSIRVLFMVLCTASLSWCAWATRNSHDQAYYMLPARFWELAAGASLFLVGEARRRAMVAACGVSTMIWVGLLLVFLSMGLARETTFPFPWALPAVLGTGLLILALTVDGGQHQLARLLGSKPLVAIGLISYSLYLWHWPVYTLLRWTVGVNSFAAGALALALTFLLGWASYLWVETPTRHHRLLRDRPAWVAVLGGLLLIMAGRTLAQEIYAHRGRLQQSVVAANSNAWYPSASGRVLPAKGVACKVKTFYENAGVDRGREIFALPDCHGSLATSRRLFVAGDSHAGAYERLLDLTTEITGVTVTLYSRGGCGIATLINNLPDYDSSCPDYQEWVIGDVLSRAHPGDVVWLASLRAHRLGNQWGAFTTQDVSSSMSSETALSERATAEREARRIINKLTAAGLTVLIDAPLPVFPSPSFRCSDWFNRMNPACDAGLSVTRAFEEAHRAMTQKAIQRLAAANPGLRVWDPLPVLCPDTTCSALDGKHPLFFDGDHLSGYGNEVLLPSFLVVLKELVSEQRTIFAGVSP